MRKSPTATFVAYAHFATPLMVAGEEGHPAGCVENLSVQLQSMPMASPYACAADAAGPALVGQWREA